MKRILLIATGGTIASVKGPQGLVPRLSPEQLAMYIAGEQNADFTVQFLQLLSLDSTNMQPEHWQQIAECIADNYSEFDGFVITHGTDTMAFTAAALSYMLQGVGKPIVLTGSQVPIQEYKTDARKNLLDALRLACEDLGGVYVVFNGHVIAGTRAVKMRTKSYDAFESINYPPVAHWNGTTFEYQWVPIKHEDQKPRFNTALNPDIFLLKLYPGTKPELFEHLKPLYRGIIIESFGNGGVPSLKRNLLPQIEALADAGVAIVITTQCLQEGEDLSLYEVGRRVAQNPKIILSYDMNTEAIVPKLMWALGQSDDIARIKEIMETPIAFDLVH
ncbi:asparaginase [Sulfoacidibacillus thermotolerans]|uniref:asparaginase n=1 Tax=Sulfoacidibacillus thermotolerans TaxID=1765684 RepID=A0A2U3D7I3_SULT2|nr:asparaginase [Sulfoacidibacillus thermotolerans]PWI57235.1 L-asparaginase 1 [Sulfoacidibacillus thermotolerans]